MSAYTLVSLQSPDFAGLGHVAVAPPAPPPPAEPPPAAALQAHPAWNTGTGWKSHLNNLRLLLQPYVCTACSCPGCICSRLPTPNPPTRPSLPWPPPPPPPPSRPHHPP